MTDDLDAFKVKTPSDVWASLQKLEEARSALDLEFLRQPGSHFITRIDALDERQGLLHISPEIPEDQRLPAPTPIRLSCTQKSLKIQFDTVVTHADPQAGGRIRLQAPLPRKLYRIQRRNTFRIANCPFDPITLVFVVDGERKHRTPLYDVSIGGCSFLFDPAELSLQVGQTMLACRLAIPDEGDIEVQIDIRTLSKPKASQQNPDGLTKAGCQFIDLPFKHEAMIQRFIIAAEQKQKTAI